MAYLKNNTYYAAVLPTNSPDTDARPRVCADVHVSDSGMFIIKLPAGDSGYGNVSRAALFAALTKNTQPEQLERLGLHGLSISFAPDQAGAGLTCPMLDPVERLLQLTLAELAQTETETKLVIRLRFGGAAVFCCDERDNVARPSCGQPDNATDRLRKRWFYSLDGYPGFGAGLEVAVVQESRITRAGAITYTSNVVPVNDEALADRPWLRHLAGFEASKDALHVDSIQLPATEDNARWVSRLLERFASLAYAFEQLMDEHGELDALMALAAGDLETISGSLSPPRFIPPVDAIGD